MIIVTGAAGFIGSNMIKKLNQEKFYDLVLVDKFNNPEKLKNIENLKFSQKIDRDDFFTWLDTNNEEAEFIFHLGARTDTAEFDTQILNTLNTTYSKEVWKRCVAFQIPLVYASSAATYGLGNQGFEDNTDQMHHLQPLNPYGESKHAFDLWAIQQDKKPFFWAGLKFFNVYGPNEEHKNRMASVVYHATKQIIKSKKMNLFRSHHVDYKNGEQKRDFVYVRDVCEVMFWLMNHRQNSDIYNLGSGHAETFLSLTKCVFEKLKIKESIAFIDTPEDIRDKYQYFTQADMTKLKKIGYTKPFTSIKEGIQDYEYRL